MTPIIPAPIVTIPNVPRTVVEHHEGVVFLIRTFGSVKAVRRIIWPRWT